MYNVHVHVYVYIYQKQFTLYMYIYMYMYMYKHHMPTYELYVSISVGCEVGLGFLWDAPVLPGNTIPENR